MKKETTDFFEKWGKRRICVQIVGNTEILTVEKLYQVFKDRVLFEAGEAGKHKNEQNAVER